MSRRLTLPRGEVRVGLGVDSLRQQKQEKDKRSFLCSVIGCVITSYSTLNDASRWTKAQSKGLCRHQISKAKILDSIPTPTPTASPLALLLQIPQSNLPQFLSCTLLCHVIGTNGPTIQPEPQSSPHLLACSQWVVVQIADVAIQLQSEIPPSER